MLLYIYLPEQYKTVERKLYMNKIRRFERIIGGRWTGIKFHWGDLPNENIAHQTMRFCEAVRASITRPVTLTRDFVDCPGALRSFGWSSNEDDKTVQEMALKRGMKEEVAKALIRRTPRLNGKISGVTIGGYESPDLILSYTQSEATMKLVYYWQKVYATVLAVKLSSVMAVCGNVAAGVYNTNKICMSFGCSESRNRGEIGRDRLVIGIHFKVIGTLLAAMDS